MPDQPIAPPANAAQPSPAGAKPAASAPLSTLGVLVVIAVLIFLAGLTVFLATHYGGDSTKTIGVLGGVVPAVTAVVGGVVGYQAGNTTGNSKGRADQANATKAKLAPVLADAAQAYETIAGTVETAGESPAGQKSLRVGAGTQAAQIDPDVVAHGRRSLGQLSGFLDGLG